MRKTEIIQRLNCLNLRKCEDDEIMDLIDNNSYAIQILEINPGQIVYRATVLSKGETIEKVKRKRLSYLPAEENKKYQRASIPGHTMFYGIMPNMNEKDYFKSGIAAAFFETSKFFRDTPYKTEWHVHIVSEWMVVKPITLLVIADPYLDNKSYRLNHCADGFRSFVYEKYPPKIAAEEMAFQEFICEQFSREVDEEYQYKITALFAKKFLDEAEKKGIQVDGLVWQSAVNIDNKLSDCLCVAISSNTIEQSLMAPDYFLYAEEFNEGELYLKIKDLQV